MSPSTFSTLVGVDTRNGIRGDNIASNSFTTNTMGQQQQQQDAVLADDVIRLNNEAIKNWLALDHVTAECLQGQSLTLLHKLCQNMARRHRHHGKKQKLQNRNNSIKPGQSSVKPSSIRNSKVTLPSPPVVAATLQLQRAYGGSSSGGIGRPYQKAFLLNPTLVKSGSFDQESIQLIAAAIFYNAGLFYHLGSGVGPTIGTSTTTSGGRLLPPPPFLDPTFRSQLVRRYYRRADTLLGRFMDTTRQPRLWTFQAAIWHNLADNAVGLAMDSPPPSPPPSSSSLSTSTSTTPPPSPSPTTITAAAAYQTMAVWVNLSQLEAFVNWVEDAEDRSFFHYSIRLAQVLRSNNNHCMN
jgi:hypothetical protein